MSLIELPSQVSPKITPISRLPPVVHFVRDISDKLPPAEAALAQYRVYFLNAQGGIEGVHEIDALTDDAAVEHARTLLAGRTTSFAFELWRGARRIHAELKKR